MRKGTCSLCGGPMWGKYACAKCLGRKSVSEKAGEAWLKEDGERRDPAVGGREPEDALLMRGFLAGWKAHGRWRAKRQVGGQHG